MESLSYTADWECDQCGTALPHAVIEEVVSTIEKQVRKGKNVFF